MFNIKRYSTVMEVIKLFYYTQAHITETLEHQMPTLTCHLCSCYHFHVSSLQTD